MHFTTAKLIEDHRKVCRRIGECLLVTSKRVEGLQRFNDCVLTTTNSVDSFRGS